MDHEFLEFRRTLNNIDKSRRHRMWQGYEFELSQVLARFCEILEHVDVLETMYGDACESIFRVPSGLVNEFARYGSSRTREIEMHPQSGELRNIVPPAPTDAHAVDLMSKGKVLEHHFCEFDG
jgi:hypothetical protein